MHAPKKLHEASSPLERTNFSIWNSSRTAVAVAVILSLGLTACRSGSRDEDESSQATQAAVQAPAAAPAAAPVATPPAESTPPAAPVKAAAKSSMPTPPNGVEPTKAMTWLKNGNIRFLKGSLRKDGQGPKDVARLSKGQKPHTILLSCSDSRVPPEIIFDQKLGEVFTVRTAGQSLDANVLGSIEYAARILGARLIVVMGHTSCGAVHAALEAQKGGSTGSSNLDALLADLKPRFVASEPGASGHHGGLRKEAEENAKGIVRDLSERSPAIKELVQSGHIKIVPAIYSLENGQVDFIESL